MRSEEQNVRLYTSLLINPYLVQTIYNYRETPHGYVKYIWLAIKNVIIMLKIIYFKENLQIFLTPQYRRKLFSSNVLKISFIATRMNRTNFGIVIMMFAKIVSAWLAWYICCQATKMEVVVFFNFSFTLSIFYCITSQPLQCCTVCIMSNNSFVARLQVSKTNLLM